MSNKRGLFRRVFIDGLSGMALGLFSTLIIGTILKQLGTLIGGQPGNIMYIVGVMAAALTSMGIGVGVAVKWNETPLVVLAGGISGVVGGYASKLLAGTLIADGALVLSGAGEPLGAFIAAVVGISLASLVSGRTRLDILLVPLVGIGTGSVAGLIVGPPISEFMYTLGAWVNWGTEQHPFIMGVIVSVLMGMFLTLPISSAAIGIILNLSGLAAGAATVGCCCNMVGFAVASYRENGFGGLMAQGIGTSMLQVPNIVRRPIIWLPVIISSAILGPVSTMLMGMTNSPAGSGMGTAGLVGQITTFQTMVYGGNELVVLVKIFTMHFILPTVITLFISEGMRRARWIKPGDMKLEVQ